MIRSRSVRRSISLLALAFFALPASGAHLHLCLDGAEPPASVHVGDLAIHHVEDSDQFHKDVDADLKSEALAKKARDSFDLPTFASVAPVLFALSVAVPDEFPRTPPTLIVPFPAYRILPPLRAPPV
jgi:hypothetical protein